MGDDLKTQATAIEPVVITMVGTSRDAIQGPTGSPITTGSTATTLGSAPNVVFNIIDPVKVMVVRFINLYLMTLLGLLTAGATTGVIPAADFYHLVLKCAGASLAPACVGLIKDLITVFGRYEQKHPLLTGSV